MTAVVLAAGGGRRMGRPKLLLPFAGRPLLSWTLELVNRLPVACRVLVLGAQAREVQQELPLAGWVVTVNEAWQKGMAGSLKAGVDAAPPGGLLLFLGDMPCVPETACRKVMRQASEVPVAPTHNGERGFPVYLPPSMRGGLHVLEGDQGARSLLKGCQLVPEPDPGVLRDVDRTEDLTCTALKA